MKKLSAVVITFNEEQKIGRALSSLSGICDEIIVVDSFSSDTTVKICTGFTEQIIQRRWAGYRDQKQFGVDSANHDWVLSLDADEEVSGELGAEILRWKNDPSDSPAGYYIPRLTLFMGRWIRHTSWYPDPQLRLFDRRLGRWSGGRVHESFRTTGPTDRLSGVILHYTYSSVSEYLTQLEQFTTLAALDLRERGIRAGPLKLALYPPYVFLKNYLFLGGFLEGMPGFAVSTLCSASTFFKYLKLWELERWNDESKG